MNNVYLLPIKRSEMGPALDEQIAALWAVAGFENAFAPNDLAAIKLHVGEPGTKTFASPTIAAALVKCVLSTGARPFLTDTVVLYRSPRDNAPGHAGVALAHGFTPAAVGAHFVPADGLNGSDEIIVDVERGRHFKKVSIASTVMQARSMLVLSHATGHLGCGFGGALKNLGMGCASKKAKLRQHFGQQPRINPRNCVICGECIQWCPTEAIALDKTAAIDKKKCIGCGECIAVCLAGAVHFDWTIMGRALQERMIEHAAAVVRSKSNRLCYVTVAQQITKDCDCLGLDQPPLLDDIGILAASDPVALDQAVLDLVRERAGRSLESMAYPKTDSDVQLKYAESMGLGQRAYTLVSI